MRYLTLPIDLKDLAYAIAQEADHTEIRVFVNAICDASMEWELDAAICSDRLKVMQVEASSDNLPMPSNEEIMKMYPPLCEGVSMKKKFEVIITKEIEVDIPDELLTEEALEEFNAMITAGSTWEDYWKHAAQYVARLDHSFVEGIGQIDYTELYEDVEVNPYGYH